MDFKIGNMKSFLDENGGKRPEPSSPAGPDGFVIGKMSDHQAAAKAEPVAEERPKRGRKAAGTD